MNKQERLEKIGAKSLSELLKNIGELGDDITDSFEKSLEEMLAKAELKINKKIKNQQITELKINKESYDCKELYLSKKDTEKIFTAISHNIPLFFFGATGTGKTVTAFKVASIMKKKMHCLCFSEGASETWLWGRNTLKGFVKGSFLRAYESGDWFLADELDSADANLLMTINSALTSESIVNPISGETIKKHKDFRFIGCGNTVGNGATISYTARNRIDLAFLNRFVGVSFSYNEEFEKAVCKENLTLYKAWSESRSKLKNVNEATQLSTRNLINVSKLIFSGIEFRDAIDSVFFGLQSEETSEIKKCFEENFKAVEKEKESKEEPKEVKTTSSGEGVKEIEIEKELTKLDASEKEFMDLLAELKKEGKFIKRKSRDELRTMGEETRHEYRVARREMMQIVCGGNKFEELSKENKNMITRCLVKFQEEYA